MLYRAPLDVGINVGIVLHIVSADAAGHQAVARVIDIRHLTGYHPVTALPYHVDIGPVTGFQGVVAHAPQKPAHSTGSNIAFKKLADIDVIGKVEGPIGILFILHSVQHLTADIQVS